MTSFAEGTNGSSNSPFVPDANVRRLYKSCVECVRKLDSCVRDKSPVNRILSAEMILVRHKLAEACEQLMFVNPKEYGRKAEEQVWKKCFYEPIQILRQSKQRMNPSQITGTLEMIAGGCGHYETFLLKLQAEFPSFPVELTKPFLIPVIHKLSWTVPRSAQVTDPSQKWAQTAVIRTLIFLGDLSRYQLEFDPVSSPHMAERYYSIASCLNPDAGMPFNQLGTLMTPHNYGCDSLYFYLRCLLSAESFEGARGNLLQILEKNEKRMEETAEPPHNNPFSAKLFLSSYLHLVKVFYEDDLDLDKTGELGSLCQAWLPMFDQSLLLHLENPGNILQCFGNLSGHADEARIVPNTGDSVSVTVLIRLVGTQLMIVKQLQDKGSLKLSAAIALMLSIFSHLLNNILMRLMRCVPTSVEESKLSQKCILDQPVEECSLPLPPVPTSVDEEKQPERKRPGELMQKRRRGSQASAGEDRNSSESDDGSQEVHSEGDVVDVKQASCDSDLEEPSDTEESLDDLNVENLIGSTAPMTNGSHDVKFEPPFISLSLDEQLKELSEMGILPVVKIMCDWLRCNPNLVVSVGQSSQGLWSRLAEVLNLFPREETILQHVESNSELSKSLQGVVWCPLSDWSQSRVLVEDLALRPILGQVHNTLDFNSPAVCERFSEIILRVFCLRSFGHFLLRLNVPGFRYDRARQVFLAPSGFTTIEEVGAEEAELRREKVAKTMANLRMQEELLHLEKVGWVPVFLVPDTSALANKLPLVQQLAATQKFVVAIPMSVIRELDKLKKESSSVREAMRWLESQFELGTKFVRPQKQEELLEVPFEENSVPSEVKDLLRFCGYLSRSVSDSSSIVVTVITNHPPSSTPMASVQSALSTSGLKGVAVENIHRFSSRWKNYRKKGV